MNVPPMHNSMQPHGAFVEQPLLGNSSYHDTCDITDGEQIMRNSAIANETSMIMFPFIGKQTTIKSSRNFNQTSSATGTREVTEGARADLNNGKNSSTIDAPYSRTKQDMLSQSSQSQYHPKNNAYVGYSKSKHAHSSTGSKFHKFHQTVVADQPEGAEHQISRQSAHFSNIISTKSSGVITLPS